MTRIGTLLLTALLLLPWGEAARAAAYDDASSSPPAVTAETLHDCLFAAAGAHGLSPFLLLVLLRVEGGKLGRVSHNTNDTVDIGPMQVNQIWLPKIAAHWHTDGMSAFVALRDNACANFEAGAWILQSAMAETGDFWSGVGLYHSHSPGPRRDYLRQVLRRALELQAIAAHDAPAAPAG